MFATTFDDDIKHDFIDYAEGGDSAFIRDLLLYLRAMSKDKGFTFVAGLNLINLVLISKVRTFSTWTCKYENSANI